MHPQFLTALGYFGIFMVIVWVDDDAYFWKRWPAVFIISLVLASF